MICVLLPLVAVILSTQQALIEQINVHTLYFQFYDGIWEIFGPENMKIMFYSIISRYSLQPLNFN